MMNKYYVNLVIEITLVSISYYVYTHILIVQIAHNKSITFVQGTNFVNKTVLKIKTN